MRCSTLSLQRFSHVGQCTSDGNSALHWPSNRDGCIAFSRLAQDQSADAIHSLPIPLPTDAVHTTLRYGDFFAEKPNVGYETLIYDCMIGDATLFQRADNIEAGWMAVEPLLAAFARGEGTPELYSAGSEGPAGAEALLASGGHRWSSLAAE
jgi:glucose-6-phosphate 1-dehydrogenase